MIRNRHHSPTRALVRVMMGIIIFLLVLGLFRLIARSSSWALFSGFVDFLSANASLIIVFSILFMIGDIFAAFSFPFNLPFPIFSAAGSVLLVSFLIRSIAFIDTLSDIGISPALDILALILYPLTIIVVLAAGYFSILGGSRDGAGEQAAASSGLTRPGTGTGTPTWEEIGGEFHAVFSHLFKRLRDDLNRK